jgi:CBS domain
VPPSECKLGPRFGYSLEINQSIGPSCRDPDVRNGPSRHFAAKEQLSVAFEEKRTKMRIRHLPVLDGEKVIGVLSSKDILDEIIAEDEKLIRDLENERLLMTTTAGNY